MKRNYCTTALTFFAVFFLTFNSATKAQVIRTVAGNGTASYSGDGGAATAAELYYPEGVAVDASNNFYIADEFNNRIRIVTSAGVINTLAGTGQNGYAGDGGSATMAQLSDPEGVAVDAAGNIYSRYI